MDFTNIDYMLVAPHTGAWIETDLPSLANWLIPCRTPHGCVD